MGIIEKKRKKKMGDKEKKGKIGGRKKYKRENKENTIYKDNDKVTVFLALTCTSMKFKSNRQTDTGRNR